MGRRCRMMRKVREGWRKIKGGIEGREENRTNEGEGSDGIE